MYQVLARKYRPRNFIELVGQNHVSRALTSALERGRLHHAYLFTGTRGVGKTTIARILAKCLNCETGVTSTPCEVCATCRAVNEGRFIDLIEIDAASRTKVEDTRELLDNVPYAPTQGRFKVYLIDEVHMLSTHSFNALLKTLEEPPEHVKFLFATTDPQKLPITVISRCLQFTLRPLAVDEITEHLTAILDKEQIRADKDAIWQIAESAQGSLRDALSLTDQAIAYGQGEVHHQDVKEMLGLIDRTIIYDLIIAIHQNQQAHVSQLLLQFRQQALDVSLVLDQLISTLHELALLQYLPELSLKYSEEINQKILSLSRMVSAQDLQLYYQIACKGRAELQLAVTQEQGFEMCVLRLLAFRPLAMDEVVVEQTVQIVSESIQSNFETQTSEPPVDTTAILNVQKTSSQSVEAEDDFALENTENFDEGPQIFEEPEPLITMDQDALESFPPPAIDESESVVIFDANSDELIGFETQPSLSSISVAEMQVFPVDEQSTELNSMHPSQNLLSPQSIENLGDSPLQSNISAELLVSSSSENSIQSTEILENSIENIKENGVSETLLSAHVQESLVSHTIGNHDIISKDYSDLMPQDILKLPIEILEGEWTLEKWEYWFRNSQLSPAVQELAQHGLMSGQIDGICIFTIPQKFEGMLSQLQYALENEIKSLWPNTQFSVQYAEISDTTPFVKQAERKQKAFERAEHLLKADPVIKSLLDTFEGELQNIQLKG
ncbi:DNA polymerase III subunit gamma/tau [Acinetobacter sp. S40]|uniref:DNA polymerase III subunit gamma/tau n=1 Tax=Acinetobacter sp. S40 TaxID=2767434 RepID=UPI001909A467|nr:DNA polymerase III subunit gamma/tau [Acinetobacter sp. S40]MBJ9984360.1 DNA polymerase III subunit gamma/tau [Acinetobacter sp. S40]